MHGYLSRSMSNPKVEFKKFARLSLSPLPFTSNIFLYGTKVLVSIMHFQAKFLSLFRTSSIFVTSAIVIISTNIRIFDCRGCCKRCFVTFDDKKCSPFPMQTKTYELEEVHCGIKERLPDSDRVGLLGPKCMK